MANPNINKVGSTNAKAPVQTVDVVKNAVPVDVDKDLDVAPMPGKIQVKEKPWGSLGEAVSAELIVKLTTAIDKGPGVDLGALGDVDIGDLLGIKPEESFYDFSKFVVDDVSKGDGAIGVNFAKGLHKWLENQQNQTKPAYSDALRGMFKGMNLLPHGKSTFEDYLNKHVRNYPVDVNALVQWVIRDSYLETTQDLYNYANKVKFYNEQKKQIREELERARAALADLAGAEDKAALSEPFVPKNIETDFIGASDVQSGGMTPEQQEQQKKIKDHNDKKAVAQKEYEAKVAEAEKYPKHYDPQPIGHSSGDYKGDTEIEDGNLGPIQTEGESWKAKVLAWWNDLPPEIRKALEAEIRAHGITVAGSGLEWDSGPNDKISTGTQTRVPKAGQSIEEFLETCANEIIQALGAAFYSQGSENPDLLNMSFSMSIGGVDYVEMPEKPDILKDGAPGPDTGPYKPGAVANTKAELNVYVKSMEEKLNTAGDDAQLANVDLQNWLQKQQQSLQMLTNISKSLHDTAMAVIRNFAG